MRIAISIPGPIFDAAERAAKRQRLSRSRFYTNAIRRYLEMQAEEEVTRRLNAIYDRVDSSLDPVIAALQCDALKWSRW